MATELQQALQRVRLVSPEGEIFKPSNRILCALDAIAAHTYHAAPELGATKAASVLGERGGGKSRRTFFRAVTEAQACGLVLRLKPVAKPGVKYQAQIYLLARSLIDASSTGYRGDLLLFDAPFEPPGKPGDPSEIKSLKATAQHAKARLAKAQARLLITKVKDGKMKKQESYPQECQFGTLEVHDTRPPLDPRSGEAASSPAFPPAPRGGGGPGIAGSNDLGDSKSSASPKIDNFEAVIKDEQRVFFGVLGDVQVTLDFQARLIKGERAGQRGGRLWAALGGDARVATDVATTAAARVDVMANWLGGRGKKRLEGVMQVAGGGDHHVLLMDDLDAQTLAVAGDWWAGAMMAIETSLGNHQAFLLAPRDFDRDTRTRLQQALATRFGGDANATGGAQLHRYPGSVNHKNGEAWVTRLVMLRGAETADASAQIDELLKSSQVPAGALGRQHASSARTVGGGTGGAHDNSRAAFIEAIRWLSRGVPPEKTAVHLATNYNPEGKHSRGKDGGIKWARHTVHAAGCKALKRKEDWFQA